MIRLRRTLERGRAHPILGPIVLIALVVLLAMVFLHAVGDGHDAATELGAFCLAILTILGPIVLELTRRVAPAKLVSVRGDRGPPPLAALRRVPEPSRQPVSFATPLRR